MPPRPRASEDLILRTTIGLIAEHGVAGVSVDAVAAVAGVSKPTIYRRWPSRTRLIQAAFSYGQHEANEPDTGTLRGDLTSLLGDLVSYLNRPDFGRAYLSFLEAAARDPELAALRRTSMRTASGMFLRAVHRGIERGELPPSIDVRLFIDMASSPFMFQRLVEDMAVREADIEPVVDLLIAAFNRVPI
jgi:AcrR family transcriptional regulator